MADIEIRPEIVSLLSLKTLPLNVKNHLKVMLSFVDDKGFITLKMSNKLMIYGKIFNREKFKKKTNSRGSAQDS